MRCVAKKFSAQPKNSKKKFYVQGFMCIYLVWILEVSWSRKFSAPPRMSESKGINQKNKDWD